ncbi:hypothetical protein AK812_SmicGene42788 [Symbiodinium microadriaticum]|uniref:DUF6570 domain-containing protein n=1 Tax=Symbiodinium microadriaticum TaxID=2951 RepID=A0A1Q9C2P2_SYMMI|nr:hypothetical protein AK812_SmicGene42788 [Symbiodinium microadriaticum]
MEHSYLPGEYLLLHRRRMPAQSTDTCDVCKDCRTSLRSSVLSLPRHALANDLWIGRQLPELQNLSPGTRRLLPLVRVCMQVTVLQPLGQAPAERQKGFIGNTIFLPQASPTAIQATLPPKEEDMTENILFHYLKAIGWPLCWRFLNAYSKAEDAKGEADSWRAVLEARAALGKYEDGLRAAEAAMVIYNYCSNEAGQVEDVAWFDSDLEGQAMIRLEQRKEGLQRAKQALVGMDKKKEAFAEAEKILDAARSLNSNRYKVEVLGQVDKAKQLAEELLPVCKELADLEAEAAAHEVIGKAVEHRGAFEQKAAKEREAEDLIIKLKQDVLEQCYEHEHVYTEADGELWSVFPGDVEELIGPVIATDPEGLYKSPASAFFLSNQPEKWRIDPEDDRKFHTAQQFDRKDPGEGAHAMGTLDLMDNAPEWEEQVQG